MYKKHKIIFLEDSKGILNLNNKKGNVFLISDEEIKEGDWIWVDRIVKAGKQWVQDINKSEVRGYKIISSTDKSLNLPEPTKEFLEEWVKNPQEEIEIEYVKLDYRMHITNDISKHCYTGILMNADNTINCRLTTE